MERKKLENIDEPENTVILLNAFDEDIETIRNHVSRLSQIMLFTRKFKSVVITCRRQFFSRDEEIPKKTGIIKVGPRSAGEGPQFTSYKIYLSPFNDSQIRSYLNRLFPFWRRKCSKQA